MAFTPHTRGQCENEGRGLMLVRFSIVSPAWSCQPVFKIYERTQAPLCFSSLCELHVLHLENQCKYVTLRLLK